MYIIYSISYNVYIIYIIYIYIYGVFFKWGIPWVEDTPILCSFLLIYKVYTHVCSPNSMEVWFAGNIIGHVPLQDS